jgi:transcriptional regulator with XRE-family HTH domain
LKHKLSPFGKIVSDRLHELNLSQKNLAKRIGARESYLSDIMRGRRPGHKYKYKILEELNLQEVNIQEH